MSPAGLLFLLIASAGGHPLDGVDMHHVVRAEDWPVMPVVWQTFELRPFDFFAGNPGLDLPARP